MARNWSDLVGVLWQLLESKDMSMKAEKLGVGDGDRLDGDGIDIWGGDIRLDSGILLVGGS